MESVRRLLRHRNLITRDIIGKPVFCAIPWQVRLVARFIKGVFERTFWPRMVLVFWAPVRCAAKNEFRLYFVVAYYQIHTMVEYSSKS